MPSKREKSENAPELMVDLTGAQGVFPEWAQAYTIPSAPTIPLPPASTADPSSGTTTGTATTGSSATPAEEPGFTGPRFYTLLRGDDWNDPQVGVPTAVPYTFATHALSNYQQGDSGIALPGFAGTSGQALTETQRAGIRQALDDWSQVSGLTFIEVSDPKQLDFHGIRFLMESVDVRDLLGESVPNSDPYGFNIVFNRTAFGTSSLQPGTTGFWTALHEIGHAIGLKHPFDGDTTLKASEDNNNNTVMSYTDAGNHSHLGAFDVAAVQHIYGTPEAKAAAPVHWFQGPGGSMLITADDQDNYIQGSVGRDVVYGGGGGDYITLDAGDDYVVPGAGSDAVFGGDGADTLYTGVLGRDAAIRASYASDGKEIQGTILLANDELDTFYGVETLDFIDVSVALDPHGDGGRLFRLYDAAFGREPDRMGFGYWMDALRDGTTSMAKVAAAFAASPEFAATYRGSGDFDFVAALYRNALGREVDQSEAREVSYWMSVSRIAGRGNTLLDFSEATEHVDKTAPAFGNGRGYVNEDAVDVLRAYLTVLDRTPDAGGMVSWTNAHEAGLTQSGLIASLASSAEFQARFGNLSNHDFVDQLYRTSLDRAPDAAGAAAWIAVLDAGIDSRTGVALGFSNSAEMTVKVTQHVENYDMYV